MSFASDVDKWCKKVPLEVNNVISFKAAGVFNEVVELSPNSPTRTGPFSTGVVKGNWYTSVNSISSNVGINPDPSGASSYSRIKTTLATLPWWNTDASVSISNSTPYIRYVEYLGWAKGLDVPSGWTWSGRSMTPYAMVQTAIVNYRARNP